MYVDNTYLGECAEMSISYLIRTNSLDSDERFVKTLKFLKGVEDSIQVFAIVKHQTQVDRSFIQRRLFFRRIFSGGSWILLKYTEMLLVTAMFLLTHRGRRWFANFDFMPLQILSTIFASRHNRPIWDLHEMPSVSFSHNPLLKKLFAYLLRNSEVIVCNRARLESLQETFGVNLSGALILRNTPGHRTYRKLIETRRNYLSQEMGQRDVRHIIITGGNSPGRFVRESVEVVKALREETGIDVRMTLVGGAAFKTYHEFVSSTGFIPFDQLVNHCVRGDISLCFYETSSINNLLCEPNRFYQAIVAGQHIFTFEHPSLQDVSYSRHHIIDEKNFASSLNCEIKKLIKAPLAHEEDLEVIDSPNTPILPFESQYEIFEVWFLKATCPD